MSNSYAPGPDRLIYDLRHRRTTTQVITYARLRSSDVSIARPTDETPVKDEVEATLAEWLPQLIHLRHELHRHPELSGEEAATAQRIRRFLDAHSDTEWSTDLGGHGIAACYGGESGGPDLLFRCELDALPIAEDSTLEYASASPGISHKCGHDGHMAIVCGLGLLLHHHAPRGSVTLLFQPAEETGAGAAEVCADDRVTHVGRNGRYAFHNLPGEALGAIVLRPETMNYASCGLRFTLRGSTSHAAEPHLARSPREALAQLMLSLPLLTESRRDALLTLVHARLGQESFGITPGDAILAVTVRAETDRALEDLVQQVQTQVDEVSRAHQLDTKHARLDDFPATVNERRAVDRIEQVAKNTATPCRILAEPMRWSEDFGHLLRHAPGALIGLGSGEAQPALHEPDYDSPDALIGPGVRFAWHLLESHWQDQGSDSR